LNFLGVSQHGGGGESRACEREEDSNQGTNDSAHASHAIAVRRKGLG